jgi:protein gp37
MGDKSGISWTDATWNPTIGCTRVSEGCRNCYAFELHDKRHEAWKGTGAFEGVPQYHKPFRELQVMGDERLSQPLRWKRSRRIFVNSMSDLFHEDVPEQELLKIVGVMGLASHHRFQVLTKRPERMLEFLSATWPTPLPNVCWGVSVEDQETAEDRIPILLQAPAARRAVSYEPALGPVSWREEWLLGRYLGCPDETDDPDTDECAGCPGSPRLTVDYCGAERGPRIDWLIIGGESGAGARPFHAEWAEVAVAACSAVYVAVHVKQMGSNPYRNGKPWRLPGKGGDMLAWPAALRRREWPE